MRLLSGSNLGEAQLGWSVAENLQVLQVEAFSPLCSLQQVLVKGGLNCACPRLTCLTWLSALLQPCSVALINLRKMWNVIIKRFENFQGDNMKRKRDTQIET